jgi:murein DD-endopeptidase MepM/ murein hydrolase activator NlpD
MKELIQKLISSELRMKAIVVFVIFIVCAVLLGVQVHKWIRQSRLVTQSQITEGWTAAGLKVVNHAIVQKENFWKVAKTYGVDIDTIVGANTGLKKLSAARGQTIRVPNQKGVIHRAEEEETAQMIAGVYAVKLEKIISLNNLKPESMLSAGLELFIPGAKPQNLSEEVAAQYGLRGIFGSPLPGRVTSNMGMRKHPVGGFRGKHTGIDLAAGEGTNIAAAAAGTVAQTGEGDYIGKFIIITHKDSYTTIYGHCSQVLAAPGKTVKKGEIIAKSGQTGRVTGPHLHFEIRKNGVPQNPLKYLW